MKIIFALKKTTLLLIISGCVYQASHAQLIISPGVHLTSNGNTQLVLANTSLINNGIINHSSGTIKFSGDAPNIIAGSGTLSLYNMDLAKSAGISLILIKNIGIKNQLRFTSGLLNLNSYEIDLVSTGSLVNEREVSRITGTDGGKIKTTAVLNAPSAANPGNLGAVFTSIENFGSVAIQRGHQSQLNDQGTGSSILRYYDITLTNNSALKTTLRFNYFDAELNGISESNLVLFKGSANRSWVEKGYTTRDATQNYVEKTNNPDFSRWTLSNTGNALASGCPGGVPTQNFYADVDGDGYGNDSSIVAACSQPAGYVTNKTDCNDDPNAGGAAIHAGATEVCNGVDDDCDGQVDEGVQTVYYPDIDTDGYGNTAASVKSCSPPAGYISTGGDCNDNNSNIKPGAVEICGNLIDDNCNGQIDEGCTVTLPLLTINDITVYESQGIAQLTVTLSAPAAGTVKVKYKTLNGTAAHPKDYLRASGELVFVPGITTQVINIGLVSDSKLEPAENFTIELSAATGATISDAIGEVTIVETGLIVSDAARMKRSSETELDKKDNYFDVIVSSNPTNAQFRLLVETSTQEKITIQISDAQGRVVEQIQGKLSKQAIYLGNRYGSGIYFAQIIQGNNRKTVKLIKL